MKVITAELILQVGSLQFFRAQGIFLFGKPAFYWKFADLKVYYGPFDSLIEAGQDVNQKTQSMSAGPVSLYDAQEKSSTRIVLEQDTKNVIKVNFLLKKRIK